MYPAAATAAANAPTPTILLLLAPETGTAEGVVSGLESVGLAVPEGILLELAPLVTIVKGASVQGLVGVGSGSRVTRSAVVMREGHPLQVMVDMDSAA